MEGKTQERCDVSGMSFQRSCRRQVAHSPVLAQTCSFLLISAHLPLNLPMPVQWGRTTPRKRWAGAGIPCKAAAPSLSSCCLQAGSSVPTLVSLQTSSRRAETSTGTNVVPGRPGRCPSVLAHPYGTDALLFPHSPTRRDWSRSSVSGPECRCSLLCRVEGFALILLLSDGLSDTRINTADTTGCACVRKMDWDANIAGCHPAMRNVEIEIEKI